MAYNGLIYATRDEEQWTREVVLRGEEFTPDADVRDVPGSPFRVSGVRTCCSSTSPRDRKCRGGAS